MSKHYDWCFTLNNYTQDHMDRLDNIQVKYLVYGKEVGESKTPHLQGYVKFPSQKTMSAAKKAIGGNAHVESRKGTPLQASDYCKKEGDYTERGNHPQDQKAQGHHGTQYWDDVLEKAKTGRMEEIDSKTQITLCTQLGVIEKRYAKNKASLDTLPGEWWYGESGSGKSREARETYPDAYIKGLNKWWDGYNGQDTVIIEDIDKFNVSMGGDLKRWLDHYSFPAEVKGGGQNIRPLKIIITSQYRIEDIWDDAATVDALNRRCHKKHFKVLKKDSNEHKIKKKESVEAGTIDFIAYADM